MKLIKAELSAADNELRISIDPDTLDASGGALDAIELTYGFDPRRAGESVGAYNARLAAFKVEKRADARALALLQINRQTPSAPRVGVEDLTEEFRSDIEA